MEYSERNNWLSKLTNLFTRQIAKKSSPFTKILFIFGIKYLSERVSFLFCLNSLRLMKYFSRPLWIFRVALGIEIKNNLKTLQNLCLFCAGLELNCVKFSNFSIKANTLCMLLHFISCCFSDIQRWKFIPFAVVREITFT